MPSPRTAMTAAYFAGTILVTGGIGEGSVSVATTDKFDVESRVWIRSPPMIASRSLHCAATVGDAVVVMGGTDAQGNVLNSVEALGTQSNSWIRRKSMGNAREGCVAVALDLST